MKKLQELLGSRDADKIIEYIRSEPEILSQKEKSGATGFMQVLYHRIPQVATVASKLKTELTFDEAVATSKIDQVKSQIEQDEELVSAFCADGFTPIGLATFFGQSDMAKLLFASGADPSVCANNAMKVNALHAAAATGSFELIELYLTNGYDANVPQMNDITAIQSAAYRGDLEMVKLLVRHGADPKIPSVDGVDAIGYAKEGNHDTVVFYLEQLKKEE